MKFLHFIRPWKAKQEENERYAEYERWYNTQLEAMQRGEEVKPPWIVYPDCDCVSLGPMWRGWSQGFREVWLHDVWFPFWKKLTEAEKDEYMNKWPPPSELWDEYLRNKWRK
jgi:hypothetical protein